MNFIKMLRLTAVFILISYCLTGAALGQKLPGYGVDVRQTSVSGLSSGAFMAAQFHVAHSCSLIGAGIIAGGPYYCAGSYSSSSFVDNAMTTCMNPIGPGPNSTDLFHHAVEFSRKGWIDDPDNLKTSKVYIFSGSSDNVVTTRVVDQTTEFYRLAKLPAENIKYVKNINAGHAIITNNRNDTPCQDTRSPFINNCDYLQSHDILKHLYGDLNPPAESLSGKLIEFEQGEFANIDRTSMSKLGYAYIPKSCETESCRVHVAFHGCQQGAEVIGDRYYTSTGYNSIADTNKIIVMYPQVKPSMDIPFNPMGCWDFWGYSSSDPEDPDFYKKDSLQMTAVIKMIDRLAEPRK